MDDEEVTQAKHHFNEALVDGVIYKLHDDAHVKVSSF